ncbi:hypothetical protein GGF49_000873 [Coemansia sp. RSA 1853]|nr:hypothetical protein GGF49_000873 [Coemansia sp. RSA 1853]
MEKCSYNDEEAVTVSGGSDEEADTDSGGTNRESTISPINFLGIPVVLDGKVPIRVYTNIKLIETFGLESMVKQLLFREDRSRGIFGLQLESLTSFISIIQTLFSGLPEETNLTEPFTKWHELENAGTVPSNDAQSRCYAASKAAANVLIHKFPNVSSMFAVMTDPHEFLQKLIVELAVGYDKKLTKFVCEIPPMFPYTLSAPNVVELGLRVLSSSHQNLPTICPRSLRKINLVVERQPFSWDMFRIDTESKTIAFDNLLIETTELLTNIKKYYPMPSSSKIETLYLAVYHDEECLESCCPMLFGGAIENLKWYWPQLKDIEFQMI